MELVNEIDGARRGGRSRGRFAPASQDRRWNFWSSILSLFTPHVADELWEGLGHAEPLLRTPGRRLTELWRPKMSSNIPCRSTASCARAFTWPSSAGEEEIRRQALADEKVIQHLAGLRVVKVIVVPQKLVSIVAR